MPTLWRRRHRMDYLRYADQAGVLKFALREGVLGFGIPWAIAMTACEVFWWDRSANVMDLWPMWVIAVVMGAVFGASTWFRCTRQLYALEAEERRQF